MLHQFARQAERQVEAADPVARPGQPVAEGGQGVEALDGLQQYPRTCQPPPRQHDGLAPRGTAGEVAAKQHQPSANAVTPAAMHSAPQMRAARSPSPNKWPPISAANSMETSRAGATWDMGASRIAYRTST